MHSIVRIVALVLLVVGLILEIMARRVPRDAPDQSKYLKLSNLGGLLTIVGAVGVLWP